MTHGIMIRRIGLLRLFGIEIFKLKKEKLHFSKHHGKVNWSNVWLMEYRHCVICACVSGYFWIWKYSVMHIDASRRDIGYSLTNSKGENEDKSWYVKVSSDYLSNEILFKVFCIYRLLYFVSSFRKVDCIEIMFFLIY